MWTNSYVSGKVMQNTTGVVVDNWEVFNTRMCACSTISRHTLDTKQSVFNRSKALRKGASEFVCCTLVISLISELHYHTSVRYEVLYQDILLGQ